jgi:hypothetical protein
MGGQRRTAAQKIAEAHAAGAVAQLGGRRTARRKLGEIDGVGGSGRKAQKNTGSYKKLHLQSSLKCRLEGFLYRFTTVKASFLVRRKINRKYLKLRAYISNTRMTGQRCCPFYAAIAHESMVFGARKVHAPKPAALEPDPEKRKPVFRKDHAPSRCQSVNSIQYEAIAL